MSADQHPFVAWVVARHGKDDNNLGDFAIEIAPSLPATGTHDELRDLLYWTAPHWSLHVFDGLWANYQHTLWAATRHAFVAWLVDHHGDEADTPLGMFARDYAKVFPQTGDRATLRAVLEAHVAEWGDSPANHPAVDCFDIAWQRFRPTCEAPDCAQTVEVQMSLCGVHAPLGELL